MAQALEVAQAAQRRAEGFRAQAEAYATARCACASAAWFGVCALLVLYYSSYAVESDDFWCSNCVPASTLQDLVQLFFRPGCSLLAANRYPFCKCPQAPLCFFTDDMAGVLPREVVHIKKAG